MAVLMRTKALGNWGEKKASALLKKAGFHSVRDLNCEKANHPFADFYAERGSDRFIIGVKTRNRLTASGKLNSSYNVRKRGQELSGVAAGYKAIPAWIAIQVDVEKQKCSAYFGQLAQLSVRSERYSIPMTPQAMANYECLAPEEYDPGIKPEWSNRIVCPNSKHRSSSLDFGGSLIKPVRSRSLGNNVRGLKMAISGATENDLLKLKSDFRRVLEICPRTSKEGEAGCAAGALRRLLHTEGWQNIIKSNDDVAELAKLCGLSVSAYPTGGRSGQGIRLVVSDPQRTRIGKSVETRDEVHRKVQVLFGFPLGTTKNAAAAMYLSDKGATTEEITKEIGGPALNLLKEVESQGHTVIRTREKSPRGTNVTRYRIIPRKGFP